MRKALTHLLESDAEIEVVGTAADGAEALELVERVGPDVVLLDLQMSRLDGLATLTHIMAQNPTPVVVLTGLNKTDATIAVTCLERGAVDVIAKPSGVISYDIDALAPVIVEKVKQAARLHLRRNGAAESAAAGRLPGEIDAAKGAKLLVIGASTGGPRALAEMLPALPKSLAAAVLVVQHMETEFVPYFAQSLKAKCRLDVAVAQENELCRPGRRDGLRPAIVTRLLPKKTVLLRVRFSAEASPHAVFPSIDFAMQSAALAYGAGAIGVLLTGTGSDGALGMQAIHAAGGATIAEDPLTCLAPGMPQSAIDSGCVDEVVALPFVARAIAAAALGKGPRS